MASARVISAAERMAGMLRELSRGGGGAGERASARGGTWGRVAAVEWTATVRMPSSRHARMTRRAISPRLATRTFLNMTALRCALGGLDAEKRLPELHRLAVLDQDLGHLPRLVRLDLVHQLHRLD